METREEFSNKKKETEEYKEVGDNNENDKIPDEEFNKESLEKGIQIEHKKIPDKEKAKSKAKSNLAYDPEYYENKYSKLRIFNILTDKY